MYSAEVVGAREGEATTKLLNFLFFTQESNPEYDRENIFIFK